MDDRWRCETEGLVQRTRPDGRTEWVEVNPPCADGHGPMKPQWTKCAVCGFVCRHWTCDCGREERTPLHVCDSDQRDVDPHRR